jgi:GrpB-like predicted nucleotidyltransferase (UPF0157 family)
VTIFRRYRRAFYDSCGIGFVAGIAIFVLEPYINPPACYQEYDPIAPRIASLITARVAQIEPNLAVEHIGSTAVPGCAGKGIVDLAVLYGEGGLDRAKQVLDTLGFQRQTTRDPFPEDRPMRVGAISHAGRTYQLHAHVIRADSSEIIELMAFRDRLRADPELREAYESTKRQIMAAGVTDSVAYCEAKGGFIRQVLEPGAVADFKTPTDR